MEVVNPNQTPRFEDASKSWSSSHVNTEKKQHQHLIFQKMPRNGGTFLSPKWIKSEMKTTGGSEKDPWILWQARVWERVQKLCLYIVLSCITGLKFTSVVIPLHYNGTAWKLHNGIQWGTGSYKTSGVFVCFIGSPQIRFFVVSLPPFHTFSKTIMFIMFRWICKFWGWTENIMFQYVSSIFQVTLWPNSFLLPPTDPDLNLPAENPCHLNLAQSPVQQGRRSRGRVKGSMKNAMDTKNVKNPY